MAGEVDLQDRLEINDLMMKYAWSFDTGDLDGVVAVFAPDGVISSGKGERHQGSENIRRYYSRFVSQPHFRGGMHFLQQIDIARTADGYTTRSYCVVADSATKAIRSQSLTTDSFVKLEGRWRLKERLLTSWTPESGFWKGPKAA